jgi:hypothetical protein
LWTGDWVGLGERLNMSFSSLRTSIPVRLPILSHDQDFTKVPDITAFSPLDWLQKGRKLLK